MPSSPPDRHYGPRVLREGDAVVYIGGEDGEHDFFQGHPGRVTDTGLWPHEVAVGFVNGPSVCLRPEDLEQVGEDEYLRRGRRLVACQHPLFDRDIARFNAEGDEWPDGGEPSPVAPPEGAGR